MEAQEYLAKKKELQRCFIEFIDHGKTIIADNQLSELLDDPKVKEDKHNLKSIFNLILAIANHHHRYSDFFAKIEQILLRFKENTLQYFTNTELFEIFNCNKRILLFLIKEKFINIDQNIAYKIQKDEYLKAKYQFYFFPEIKSLINIDLKKEIEKEVHQISSENFGIFENMRNLGENDDKICELIRKDSEEDFISYLNKTNTTISSKIKPSIFETNEFLLNNEPTLIEYASFFGSIQIFKYLHSKGAELTPSLWLYAIHGNNLELLDIIKQNQIKTADVSFKDCIHESIKCHHNEVAKFIQTNFIQNRNIDDFIHLCSARYNNYVLLSDDVKNIYFFYSLCQNDNVKLVENLLKISEIKNKVNAVIISNNFTFNKVQTLLFTYIISNSFFKFNSNFNLLMEFGK